MRSLIKREGVGGETFRGRIIVIHTFLYFYRISTQRGVRIESTYKRFKGGIDR